MAACHCSGCCWSWCPPYSSTSRPQCPKVVQLLAFGLRLNGMMSFFSIWGTGIITKNTHSSLSQSHLGQPFGSTNCDMSIRTLFDVSQNSGLATLDALKSDQLRDLGFTKFRDNSRHIHFQYGHRSDKVVTPAAGSTNSATNSQCCNDLIQHETASTWPKCSNNGEVSGWNTTPVKEKRCVLIDMDIWPQKMLEHHRDFDDFFPRKNSGSSPLLGWQSDQHSKGKGSRPCRIETRYSIAITFPSSLGEIASRNIIPPRMESRNIILFQDSETRVMLKIKREESAKNAR